MRRLMIALLMLPMFGCATSGLKDQIGETIYVGDSVDVVLDRFGKPDKIEPSLRVEGAQAWYYVNRSEICGFTIKDQTVLAVRCGDNPDYRRSIVRAFFEGLQQNRSVSCTSNTYGGTTYTNCN